MKVFALIATTILFFGSCVSKSQSSHKHIATEATAEMEATCTGSKSCSACKNCKYCKHCAKEGGTCGVCK